MFEVKVIDSITVQVIHEQPAKNIGIVNELMRDFHTQRVEEMKNGSAVFSNHDRTKLMKVTWEANQ